MEADRSILQDALRKEVQAADRRIHDEIHTVMNGANRVTNTRDVTDNRATAMDSIRRLQRAIEYYDRAKSQLDALEMDELDLAAGTGTVTS